MYIIPFVCCRGGIEGRAGLDPKREVFAFLRWRLDDGALTLGIQLHRIEHVRQAVFKQIVIDIAGRTMLPAVFGKSEN